MNGDQIQVEHKSTDERVEKQRLPEECWIWRRPDHHLEVNFTRPPDVHEAVKYMRVMSRQEVDKIAGEGVDVQQYINSLLRTIEGQKRHIASMQRRVEECRSDD